jgi:hypothetical protein
VAGVHDFVLDGNRRHAQVRGYNNRDVNMKKPLFAFVLMPFDQAFNDIYKLGIKQTVESVGMITERVDEQVFHDEKILERIYNLIDASDFIIADMSGRNPNVFYEVGYAHAKGKRCILLTSSADDIPFDLRHHRHIIYNDSITSLKENLSADLHSISNDITSPILAEVYRISGDLEKTAYVATGVVKFQFDLTNPSGAASPEIDHIYFYTGKNWRFSQDKLDCPSTISDIDGFSLRHQLQPTVKRLQKGAWARFTITARKALALKLSGETLEDKYTLNGSVLLRIVTNKGVLDFPFPVSVDCEEFPF